MNDFDLKIINKLNYIYDSKVKDALLYSLCAGGKRIRPRLLYETVKGFNRSVVDLDNIGVALEMIHTYSLIHDDLPAMDNDVLRRGKNTCHVEFDEATAILAGDALLNEAFYLVSIAKIDPNTLIKCINLISSMSGVNGMIYGQCLDIEGEGLYLDIKQLEQIHMHKTGALISLPLQLGCILCEKEDQLNIFKEIGFKIGLAFQVQDDILDVTSSSETLGKSNSDIVNEKSTVITVLGLKNAEILMHELYNDIRNSLNNIKDFNSQYLIDLIDELSNRRK